MNFNARTVQVRGFRSAAAFALLAATTLGTGVIVAPAVAQTQTAVRYDIPAGQLSAALNRFAEASGVKLFYDASLTNGRSSPGLQGSFTAVEALSRLLAGSGLTFRQTGAGAYTLERAPQAAAGAIALGPVRVEGEGDGSVAPRSFSSDPDATEGTGAYIGSRTTTASRMPLTVKETPQSVTVVTRQRIDDFQLQTMQSVLTSIVGVSEERWDSDRGGFSARGFTVTNLQMDGIATPFAGATRSAINSPYLDSYLYDRIEVVRGATGLLSATGDPSATINLVRKKPGTEFAASGFLTAGSRDLYRGGVDVSVPIAADGAVRARLIGLYHKADSFRVRASDERLLLSGMLEADLSPTTLLRIANVYQDTESRGSSYGSLPRYYSDGGRLDMPRSTNLSTTWSRVDKTENRTDVTLEQQVGEDWTVVASLGRTRLKANPKVYFWGYGAPDRAGNGRMMYPWDSDGKRTQWTYDAHLNGSFGLFGREHMLMLGVNGYRRTDHQAAGGVAPLGAIDTNIFTFTGIVPEPARGPRDMWFITDKEKMDGVFGSLRLSLADPLHVIVGGRVTDWRTTQLFQLDAVDPGTVTENRPGRVFTPFFGATFDILPELTIYASYADLFTPQTERDVDNRVIDPIVGSNKEVGLKAALLDGGLTINAALYEAKRDNVAELIIPEVILPDGGFAYRSTGKGNKTRGFEIEVSGSITDRWNIYTGYNRNKTKDANGVVTNTITPQQTFKLQTTWKPPVLDDRLTIGGGLNWQSAMWQDCDWCVVGQPIRVEQEGYALVSLMARFDATDRISVSLNANNLFDKAYYTSAIDGNYGEPRSVLATVSARF